MGDNLLMQALLIGAVSYFCGLNSYFGSIMIGRPMVVGALTGLVLGDLQTGVIVGATMELAFLGAVPIGASNPPDMKTGTIMGTAFVILSGRDIGMAVALGIPVASLMSIVGNVVMMFVNTEISHACDRAAERGDTRRIEILFNISVFGVSLLTNMIVVLGFYFGMPVMEKLVEHIPEFILTGMNVTAGLLPAIGCAMLARMLMRRELAPYLLIGFLMVVYLNVPAFGVALAGLSIAVLLYFNDNEKEVAVNADDNEF